MKVFFTALMVVFIASSAFAQIGLPIEAFALTGNGARAAGMGNAFTGIADDASAISWNPAGLTQLQSMEASVVGRINFGSGSVDFPEDQSAIIYSYFYQSTDYGLGLIQPEKWDVEVASQFKVNFASLVFPFQVGSNNVVGGIAYRNLYDFSREITENAEGELLELNFYDGSLWTYGNEEYMSFRSSTGGINAISPSLGFQINEMFSLGATVNILTGSVDVDNYDEVFDAKFAEDEYSIDFSGTAIDLGVLVKPTPTFSIGANLNLPHTITGESEGDEIDLEIPFFFSVGAGFRATENLLIGFDYRSRPWSDTKLKFEEFEDDSVFVEDANSIHVGLEYLVMAGDNVMPLRLGFYTQPLPEQDALEDQKSNNVFTAGIGLLMGNIIFDGSFEWAMSSFASRRTQDDDPIDFTGNEFRVSVGAVIHFGQ